MKSVRIELIPAAVPNGRPILAVDVVCDCGANGLADVTMSGGEASFKHRIGVGCSEQDRTLLCRCGKEYLLRSQESHVHVFNV